MFLFLYATFWETYPYLFQFINFFVSYFQFGIYILSFYFNYYIVYLWKFYAVSYTNLQYSQLLVLLPSFQYLYLFNVWNYFRVHIWWLCSSYKSDSTLYFLLTSSGYSTSLYIFFKFLFWTHVPLTLSMDTLWNYLKHITRKKKKKKRNALFAPTSCLQALTNSGPLGLNFCLRIFLEYSGTVSYVLQTKVNSYLWVRNSQMKCFWIFLFFLFKNSIQIKVQDTEVSFVGMGFLVCPLWVSSIRVLFLNRACQPDFLPSLDRRLCLLTSMLYTIKTKFVHKHTLTEAHKERKVLSHQFLSF